MKRSLRIPKYRAPFPSAAPTSNCATTSMAFPTRTLAATRCRRPLAVQSFCWQEKTSRLIAFWREHYLANGAAPGEQQDDADQNERQAQTRPQAEGAPATLEAQPCTERKTNNPVGREVAEHGRARIASAAESARGYGLDTVEQLKGGTCSEQENRATNDGFVRCVHPGDPTGK